MTQRYRHHTSVHAGDQRYLHELTADRSMHEEVATTVLLKKMHERMEIDDFSEDQVRQRLIAKCCLMLMREVGVEIWWQRIQMITQDPHHHGKYASLKYVYDHVLNWHHQSQQQEITEETA